MRFVGAASSRPAEPGVILIWTAAQSVVLAVRADDIRPYIYFIVDMRKAQA